MTAEQQMARKCWMILVCLSMPAWHPARTRRLPEIATELAHLSVERAAKPS